MRTSKVAVFEIKNSPFAMDEVAVASPGDGEILVRSEYTTLCRSDLNTFTGKRTEKTPTILGHEIVGVIEEMGPNAPTRDSRGGTLAVGDRITWAIYASNPDCCLARMGIPQKGDGLFKYGHEQITPDSHLHGGLSDYCLLRKHTPVIKIVKPLPLPVIAIINCAVATVAGSLRLAGPLTGRTVLVTGAGMLGIIACAMAKAGGAAKVIAVDIDDDRLAATRAFGADATVRIQPAGPSIKQALEQTMGKVSIDVALDYSGVPETMEASLEVLGIGGTAVWVGATFPQRPLQISAEKAVRNIHTIKGLHNYNEADLIAAVEFIENHCETYPFASLVHDKFTLDQVDAAFAYALSSGAHRVGIRLT